MPRARTGLTRQCAECGQDIYLAPSEINRRKYCSRECQSVAIDRERRTECAQCGTSFGQSPSMNGKFCSWTCYLAGRSKRMECAVCGAVLKQYQATYCSHECRDQGRRTMELKPCLICGVDMKVQPYQFETKKVCSRVCNDELKRRQPKREGARYKRADGYIDIYMPSHPDSTREGRILEHRLIMAQQLGRRLLRSETVNHINHIRDDNRPENLEVMTVGDHARESNGFGKQLRAAQRAKLAEYERRFGPLD